MGRSVGGRLEERLQDRRVDLQGDPLTPAAALGKSRCGAERTRIMNVGGPNLEMVGKGPLVSRGRVAAL